MISEETREATSRHISSSLGEEALEIYNTFSLSTMEQKPDILFKKFEDYCNSRRNITFERHKFFTCDQEPTESIAQYITRLRTKASTCEFGEPYESLRATCCNDHLYLCKIGKSRFSENLSGRRFLLTCFKTVTLRFLGSYPDGLLYFAR